jgi:hypothetical protein
MSASVMVEVRHIGVLIGRCLQCVTAVHVCSCDACQRRSQQELCGRSREPCACGAACIEDTAHATVAKLDTDCDIFAFSHVLLHHMPPQVVSACLYLPLCAAFEARQLSSSQLFTCLA